MVQDSVFKHNYNEYRNFTVIEQVSVKKVKYSVEVSDSYLVP